jgi:hypothetical protein
MHDCIEKYRDLFANDLERRLAVTEDKLPPALGVTTLLNPLFGLEPRIVGCGLMTSEQYRLSRKAVISLLHDILDKDSVIVVHSSSDDDDSDDGVIEATGNSNYNRAVEEFTAFERFKKKRYLPTMKLTGQGCLKGSFGGKDQVLFVGPFVSYGKDLPSNKNIANYIDKNGRMDLLEFFEDHQKLSPTLWILAQRVASIRVVEVGCERFFAISGYVSAPRRSRLDVRNYERLAMLSTIIRKIYVDPKMVAAEYLKRCRLKQWKREDDEDALKCWNLEVKIESELDNKPHVTELSMDDIEVETDGEGDENDDD